MAQPRSRNNKRARVDEEATKEEDQDVRLCAVLRGLLGGSKYVKQSELSREVLLSYAIQKGDVVPVTLFTVTVQNFGGSIFDVKMEDTQNSVKQLKLLIQEEQGTPRFSQALFLLPKSGKTEEASEFPMTDEYLIEGSCSVVISVQTPVIAWAKAGTGFPLQTRGFTSAVCLLLLKRKKMGMPWPRAACILAGRMVCGRATLR